MSIPGFKRQFAGVLSGPVQDALLNSQFYNRESPEEVQQLGNAFGSLLGKGAMNFKDNTGNVSINPLTGQFEFMGKNFGVGINANSFDPSAELKFQFGKAAENPSAPRMMQQFLQNSMQQPKLSPGRQAMEEQVDQYRSNNPYWYRP